MTKTKKKDKSINLPREALSKVDCQFCKGTGEGKWGLVAITKCKRCYGIGWFWAIDNKWIIDNGAKGDKG